MRWVVVNLISNAVKFIKKGEVAVIVRAKPVTTGESIANFFEQDTGIGIPQDRMDGEEAILAVRRQPYDVVLMDVQMPRMDGLDVARHLCAQYKREHRPVIIGMTAHALASDREECLQAGMDD